MDTRPFPGKTALALATAVLLLAAVHRADPGKGLNPGVFADAVRLSPSRKASAPATANPSPDGSAPATAPVVPPAAAGGPAVAQPPLSCLHGQAPANGKVPPLPPISPYLVDDSCNLDPFFAELRALELPPQPGRSPVVTILHYGDSPTTADLITGDVRQLLQARFGDAGRGYLLAARPWAWYQHRGVDIDDHGWSVSTAVGKGRDEVYGIGGASFTGDTSASTRITLHDGKDAPAETSLELAFLRRPKGGQLQVSVNGSAIDTVSTAADFTRPDWRQVALPGGTKTVDLKPVSGSVRLFGESFFTGRRGVVYDSLGLNGASTSVLSNGFNAAAWTAALQHTAPQLVIINYGTNESSFAPYVDKYYEATLRTAIARIRAALPGVPILVMSPMDRGQRTGVDEVATMDTIPRIVAIQRRVAAELHCGFFDTFDAMGGDGTMARWYSGQPRLVAGDLIHPSPQGAAIVARLFVKDLSLGYDRYLRRQQPGYQPASQPAAPAPEPAKMLGSAPAQAAKPKPPVSRDLAVPVQPEPVQPEPVQLGTVQPESVPSVPASRPPAAPEPTPVPPTETPKAPTQDEPAPAKPAAPPPA